MRERGLGGGRTQKNAQNWTAFPSPPASAISTPGTASHASAYIQGKGTRDVSLLRVVGKHKEEGRTAAVPVGELGGLAVRGTGELRVGREGGELRARELRGGAGVERRGRHGAGGEPEGECEGRGRGRGEAEHRRERERAPSPCRWRS